MGQDPTEPHAGRSTFLLSSGGAGGGGITEWPLVRGPVAAEHPLPCQMLVAYLGIPKGTTPPPPRGDQPTHGTQRGTE